MSESKSENTSDIFQLTSEFSPKGDQPAAIEELTNSFQAGNRHHVLMGVTGSGKTFTVANLIQKLNKPALVMAPNKTLAAQLFSELRELFPENAVEFFISYYDYFQPEAYIASSDTYIAKDSAVNDDIDKMRHAATRSLFERKDVIIVASVSCIYGLGSPQSYAKLVFFIEKGMEITRQKLLRKLVDIQYSRNDSQLQRGSFRVRGDIIDILPSHQKNESVRVELFGDEIENIFITDTLTGKTLREVNELSFYPNSHYVSDRNDVKNIVREILEDLGIRLRELKAQGKIVEYQRIEQRVMHDVEMFEQLGYCPGIENYSRYLTGLPAGHPPPTLLDYFPKEFLTILDESHLTVPQIRGMYRGDRARKQNLVDYGFRLPSALDNRPLNFDEFLERSDQILYVSATPSTYEVETSPLDPTEQVIRPTGLLDPPIEIKPISSQVDDLYSEIIKSIAAGLRTLVTTLTKKMAEDLTTYYEQMGVKIRYVHADVQSLERIEILKELRTGVIDVLVGINLLREGLDLPEVGLVAVMDADKEGFLRSKPALIQVTGRAARNSKSRVIFYADKITASMAACMDETKRRREIQALYNSEHGITPTTVHKKIAADIRELYGLLREEDSEPSKNQESLSETIKRYDIKSMNDIERIIKRKSKQMEKKAAQMEFEDAAELRDEINHLKEIILSYANEIK